MTKEKVKVIMSVLTGWGEIIKVEKNFEGTYEENCKSIQKWSVKFYNIHKGRYAKANCYRNGNEDKGYNFTITYKA